MAFSPSNSPGFLASLRGLGDGLLAGLQDRLELFSIEFREEKLRLLRTFIWISAAVFTGAMAATFASLTLVYLFWDSARLAVLGGLAAFHTVSLVMIIVALRRHLARQPEPFAATLREIGVDRACFRTDL
jgi:uncharacterized membrane protein YqjE